MRNKGFTLIELLVVIAIIAILAAILFPVFTSAKRSAQQTTCLKHGGQLGNALSMYVDDNGGKFPFCWVIRPGKSTLTWAFGLAKYTKSLGVFTCPAVPNRRFTNRITPGYNNDADRITGGWGYNTSLGTVSSGQSRENGVGRGKYADANMQSSYSLSDITMPTQHIVFGDSKKSDDPDLRATFPQYVGNNAFCDVIKAMPNGAFDVPPDYRHNNGAIFIFCDGHAKWIPKNYFANWQKNSHHWFVDNRNH